MNPEENGKTKVLAFFQALLLSDFRLSCGQICSGSLAVPLHLSPLLSVDPISRHGGSSGVPSPHLCLVSLHFLCSPRFSLTLSSLGVGVGHHSHPPCHPGLSLRDRCTQGVIVLKPQMPLNLVMSPQWCEGWGSVEVKGFLCEVWREKVEW